MLLLRMWNYMRGYVIIIVKGYSLEKFINICIHRKIFLWDIKKQKNSTMVLKLRIKGFKLLRPVVKKTGCRVKILSKRGLPFKFHRFKKRKAFVLGAVIFIILVYIMTSFIWAVDIKGNKKISSRLIIDKLASYGIKTGVLKYRINTDEVVNDMMVGIKELAWISIEVKGTMVKVNIKERVNPPKLIPNDSPCDIIAYRDGVIKSIFTKVGQQIVNEGDTVKAGQILISGNLKSENKEAVLKQVHAIGTIEARTWYEKSCKVDQKLIEKRLTGNKKNRYSLVLFSKQIDLFKGDIPFEKHEDTKIEKKLTIGDSIVLPFGLVIDSAQEYQLVEHKISLSEAKKIAGNKALKAAKAEIPKGVKTISSKLNFIKSEKSGLVANVIIECIEDIGITKKH
jgi:similar to stage IV sporulation protein